MRSLVVRKSRAELRDMTAWSLVVAIARWEQPRTLEKYATLLNDYGLKSPNGGEWTTSKLSHVFNRHGTKPKELTARMTDSVFEPIPKLPESECEKLRAAIRHIDMPSETNGQWIKAIQKQPQRGDFVRHPVLRGGSFVREERAGRMLCRFVFDSGTRDVPVPASDIEVFLFNRSREERQAMTDRMYARFFGSNG
ncbi:MAG: hypothetical protein ABL931_00170 [Usitatibacteraceae bacterium]